MKKKSSTCISRRSSFSSAKVLAAPRTGARDSNRDAPPADYAAPHRYDGMSKTLSQWEIDALLNSIGSDDSTTGGAGGAVGVLPNIPERSIKLYDFRRP